MGSAFMRREYFCCSRGNVTDEVIREYIRNLNVQSEDDFIIAGGTE